MEIYPFFYRVMFPIVLVGAIHSCTSTISVISARRGFVVSPGYPNWNLVSDSCQVTISTDRDDEVVLTATDVESKQGTSVLICEGNEVRVASPSDISGCDVIAESPFLLETEDDVNGLTLTFFKKYLRSPQRAALKFQGLWMKLDELD